ncbi:hypothetical protein [Tichowtungia aerotolerans]|uniref:Uncharacterized protein n=1 Tax=Tichowtungia aerotolerans TaxID=2697043 RepID=A0A6P1MBX2_9BACT|nr:hypothetical protein [Tichowtungia aerotolerans]QHI68595.1 hypothetical protein GT409_03730 [Tichowtungia aerotolerans]
MKNIAIAIISLCITGCMPSDSLTWHLNATPQTIGATESILTAKALECLEDFRLNEHFKAEGKTQICGEFQGQYFSIFIEDYRYTIIDERIWVGKRYLQQSETDTFQDLLALLEKIIENLGGKPVRETLPRKWIIDWS